MTTPLGDAQPHACGVRLHPTTRHTDARGWLLKVLQDRHISGAPFGEIYLTSSHPGVTRAGHLHHVTREWFCPVAGRATLVIGDATGVIAARIELNAADPLVVEVPPGVAHLLVAAAAEPFLLLAFADRVYDPDAPDTTPVNFR